jgi:hypothetical protein
MKAIKPILVRCTYKGCRAIADIAILLKSNLPSSIKNLRIPITINDEKYSKEAKKLIVLFKNLEFPLANCRYWEEDYTYEAEADISSLSEDSKWIRITITDDCWIKRNRIIRVDFRTLDFSSTRVPIYCEN